MSEQLSIWYENYLELRKKREARLKLLHTQQKRVQYHEKSLFKIRNYLARAVMERSHIQEKYNQLIQYDVWVTADEHEKIHLVRDRVEREYSEWTLKRKAKLDAIDQEAKKAKLHASHLIGIERALICLEDMMRKQVMELPCDKKPELIEPLFFRKSTSHYSFASVVTADSNNSTCLSGVLLKKWLEPRLQLSQTQLAI
ncbi:hypothetical protein CU098_010074 [Rhizopus stolonifer]|uniref:Uncharacterized protein n=1 Tax=Rhizopus stolonifer TaxID=4846 RepID=A0A367JGN2_RHIST|nr:hypothetical protein CU098_010074 [Rhizopus stolonifer]